MIDAVLVAAMIELPVDVIHRTRRVAHHRPHGLALSRRHGHPRRQRVTAPCTSHLRCARAPSHTHPISLTCPRAPTLTSLHFTRSHIRPHSPHTRDECLSLLSPSLSLLASLSVLYLTLASLVSRLAQARRRRWACCTAEARRARARRARGRSSQGLTRLDLNSSRLQTSLTDTGGVRVVMLAAGEKSYVLRSLFMRI